MAVEGSLDLFGLPEILQMIAQQGKTGILTIQGQQDIVAVSFLSGRIVAADSLGHTVEEGLSQVLVGEGLMGAADFARANAENQAAGGRLLDFLVERGLLTRPELLGALRLQTIRQLGALLHWQEGDFKFYSGDEVSYEEGFEPISVEDFLLRSLADFAAAAPPPPRPAAAPRPAPPAWAAPAVAPPAVAPPATLAPLGAGWPAPAGNPGAPARSAPAAPAAAAPRAYPAPAPSAGGGGDLPPRPRQPRSRPDSGELLLPDIPDLPEVTFPDPRTPPPPNRGSQPAAGGAAGAAAWPAAAAAAPPASRGPGAAAAAPTPAWPATATAPLQAASGSPAAAGSPAAGAAPGAAGASGQPVPWPAAAMSSAAVAAPAAPGRGARPEGGRAAASAAAVVAPPAAAALPKQFRQMRIERPDRSLPLPERLVAAVLALGLAALLVVAVRSAPQLVELPFPWQQSDRGALLRNQREALYDKIDRAAKTAFLRDGRFPDHLEQLVEANLLAPSDLIDPSGVPLHYTAREDSYLLQANAAGKTLSDSEASESIGGNFLLDPNQQKSPETSGPPIVLLD